MDCHFPEFINNQLNFECSYVVDNLFITIKGKKKMWYFTQTIFADNRMLTHDYDIIIINYMYGV
jgi:hypothetical protein